MDEIFRFLALLTTVFHPTTTGCCSCRRCDRRLGGADVDDCERGPIKEEKTLRDRVDTYRRRRRRRKP